MKKYLKLFLIVLPFLVANLSYAAAAEQSPEDVLKNATNDLLRLVYDTPNPDNKPFAEVVRPEIEKYFDAEGLTRRAIGPAWRKYTPEQRRQIIDLFTEVIMGTYLDSFEPGSKPKVNYIKTTYLESKTPRCELDSSVEYEGKRYNVSYRMEKGANGWKIYDLIGEGVSLVANYRSQLEPITKRGGAEAIITALQKNLVDIKAKQKK